MLPRTIDVILYENPLKDIHLVVANPNWEHFHPTDCPQPILDWLDTHMPGTVVERVAEFDLDSFSHLSEQPLATWLAKEDAPPVFWLNLTEDKIDMFEAAWHETNPSEQPDDFYHLVCPNPLQSNAGRVRFTDVPPDAGQEHRAV